MTDRIIPLDQLQAGSRGVITRLSGQPSLRHRLAEMGILRGEVIISERIAPLGDPTAYLVKGYHLSLRRSEASHIMVRVSPD